MTTTQKRRGKRPLAAILAAMLMASVLAVVAGSPAHAANTSAEVFGEDTNNDGVKDAREFAGRDRYDTALKLAHNFAGRSSVSQLSAVFLASGESLVDSISVAGLAGDNTAPVLLTPSGSLHGGVADYIEDHNVAMVYVLGGKAAISDATVTAIEALVNKPKVTRIPGADRYETAARIGSMIGGQSGPASTWCRNTSSSASPGTDAVLINGATDALPFGVAVSTIAYKLRMPVLMTAADELPSSTADFISDHNVEHVQIIGGTDTVSAEVANALAGLGVDTIGRTNGATAAEVSVELAKLASAGGACNSFLTPVAADRAVLVRGNPDGVAAAPVLANGIAEDTSHGSMITPLIVGDTLPASVRDYLAATPKSVGTARLDLGIVAIGGTAAVSAAVMEAATTAAAATGALTVRIGAYNNDLGTTGTADDPVRPDPGAAGTATEINSGTPTGPRFSLYFSDAVDTANALEALRDIIEINGVPAVVFAAGRINASCDSNRIDVTLGQALNPGDTISVVRSASPDHRLGDASDRRNIEPATATVQAAAADRIRPAVTIIGIADATPASNTFTVVLEDAKGFSAAAADTLLEVGDFTFVAASGKGTTATNVVSTVTHTAVAKGDKAVRATVTIGRNLEVLDQLTLKTGRVMDASGNANTQRTGFAAKAQESPKIQTVLMSNPVHSAQNKWAVPVAVVPGAALAPATEVTITAKAGGDADGAAGNDWKIIFDQASTYSTLKPLDIDVRVDPRGKRATVRFNNGPATATLGDLIAAMNDDSEFSERFTAGFANCTSGNAKTPLGLVTPTPATARNVEAVVPTGGAANAGRTQFAIEVNFNTYIASYDSGALLDDVFALTVGRAKVADRATLLTAASGYTASTAEALVAPSKTVRYKGEVDNSGVLPQARDLVSTNAGHANACSTATAVQEVATGYAGDTDATDTVCTDRNAASQVRIAVSGSVKAR